MSLRPLLLVSVALLCLFVGASVRAQLILPAEKPVRIARFPALSPDGSRVCFSYQGNLWIAPASGGDAIRLTANDSLDTNPRWSPDGKWLAFNSDREGGSQVFLIPAIGGPARQITFHSVAATVHDWFPDGRSLLVTSARDTRNTGIYRLDAVTGRMKRLVKDDARSSFTALSPDGKWLAYTRGALVDTIRKNYKGAANYDIYVAPTDGSAPARRLTDSDKNDMWPVWGADNRTVFYSSERDGVGTIWKQSREGGRPVKVVSDPPDSIRFVTIARNGATLAFESDNRVCTAPTGGGRATPVTLYCRTDERGPKTNYATFTGNNVSEFALSPDGKRAAFVIRGDIFVVTIEKGGEAKRLTDNPTRDQDITWSPDGKNLVFSSNRSGSFKLYLVNLASRETRPLTQGSGIDTTPRFSPDGSWIAFRRGPKTGIYLIKPDGKGEQVAVPGPKVDFFRWSPDSKWIAYSQENDIRTDDVWVIPLTPEGTALKPGTPINVSDHPGFNEFPAWFSDGTKLAFLSNRTRNRDVETINHVGRFGLYTVPLEREKEKFEEDEDAPRPMPKPEEKKGPPKVEVKVDPREIERRAKQIVGLDEGVQSYSVSPDSKTIVFTARSLGQSDIWQTSAEGGSLQRLTNNGEAPGDFQWTPDSNRFYFLSGGAIRWMGRGGMGGGVVGFTARMEIDRLTDYRAAFDEAWQVFNDRFYDRNFHGVDWKAVGQKYRALVEYVTVRSDFNYLIQQMFGELNASHTGIFGGAGRPARETGYTGILADEEYTGMGVKIASILPRSPADRDESRLKPGEYLLSVDGVDVQADASFDKAMTGKMGRTVTLLVNATAAKEGARKVLMKPIGRGEWGELLYERWLDERRELVEKVSGGRLGYLHVADMGNATRNRFERELFSVGQRKQGMILDFRGNNGGDTHDSLLRILERNRHYFTFAPRTETPFPQPERAYVKPVILLIDEASLSDAEVFANGFRELKIGKIVGQPTMGWIIFTSGTGLIDGSFIRVPHLGCFTLDGRDMENWGVPPDIRVENTPADLAAGRDPQLERAVAELLKDSRLSAKK